MDITASVLVLYPLYDKIHVIILKKERPFYREMLLRLNPYQNEFSTFQRLKR